MKTLIVLAIYLLIGITGRKVFGYKGLLETVIWPIGIICTLYLKRTKEDKRK